MMKSKKQPAGGADNSAAGSPDVSRQEPAPQAALPKGVPTSMKKPAFMLNKKPAGSKPNMGMGQPKMVGRSKGDEFMDEEIDDLMPESMKARQEQS
jgi:hypothetical protein